MKISVTFFFISNLYNISRPRIQSLKVMAEMRDIEEDEKVSEVKKEREQEEDQKEGRGVTSLRLLLCGSI